MLNEEIKNDLIQTLIRPETDLERQLIAHERFKSGLFWGEPRYGHPEGNVIYHIREVLDNVEKLSVNKEDYLRLRLITITHDTFKYKEHKGEPRDWTRHHGILARQFLAKFTDDRQVLDITELHDEAYYCWRLCHLYHREQEGMERLDYLLSRIKDFTQLYYLFFKCDTRTGDKIQSPVKWFENVVQGIEKVKIG